MNSVAVQFPKLNLEFNLTREAFVIGEFSVYWYAVLIALGAVLAVIYGLSQAKKYGIDSDKLTDIIIVALIFGIIGARLYYVIFNIQNYSSFAEVINIRDGGLAIYGALILGIVSAFVVSRINKTRFLPCLDIAAGGFFIGQAIGRWGNFVNQEAFGVNTDSIFGMYSSKTQSYLNEVGWELFKQGVEVDPSKPVHPCFLYESVWCAIGLILLLLYRKHRKFDGELFLFYAAWYGTGRAAIEGIRTDSLMLFGFRVSQVLSVLAVIVSISIIVYLRIKISKERLQNPRFMQLYVDEINPEIQIQYNPELMIERAEKLLNEASDDLNCAENNLKTLYDDTSEISDDLESLAEKMRSPEETIGLVSKQLELVITKISIATTYIDKVIEPKQDQSDVDEGYFEDDESYEESIDEQIDALKQEIASAKDYINECFDSVNKAKELLSSEEEPPCQDREAHEILDTVSDDNDFNEPSPNESK